MKKYFAAAALLMMMAACGSAGQDKKLEGTTWKLAKMEAIPAAAVGKEADFFTLEFNAADTMVAGRTNCNRFFGKYELKGKELELKNLGMTRMACPDMQYEDAFVKMLDEAAGAGKKRTAAGKKVTQLSFCMKNPVTGKVSCRRIGFDCIGRSADKWGSFVQKRKGSAEFRLLWVLVNLRHRKTTRTLSGAVV